MLEKVKQGVFETFGSDEHKGVFLSAFDKHHELLVSHGIVSTETPLHESIDVVYNEFLTSHEKKIRYVACDVVDELIDMTNSPDIMQLDMQEFGLLAIDTEDDISGVILPNTSGVQDVKSALYDLKKKYGIHGKVHIYAFRTQRIVISK